MAMSAPKPGVVLEEEEKPKSSWIYRILPLFIFLIVVACAGLLVYSSWSSFVDLLFSTLEAKDHKLEQALVINGVLVFMIVCCLPGPGFMILLDGFFFGFMKGFALGITAELIGYSICILLARTCFKARMRQWILESEMLHEVLRILEDDSTGKFLVLFRFISLPVWVKNYAMGMLDISYFKAVLVVLPGEIFYTGIFSYIGSKGKEIAVAMRKGNTQKALDSFSGFEVLIFGASLLGMVLMIALGWREYLSRRAAVVEGAHDESAPLVKKEKPVV